MLLKKEKNLKLNRGINPISKNNTKVKIAIVMKEWPNKTLSCNGSYVVKYLPV